MAVVLRRRHIDWTIEWTLYTLLLATLWETMYVTKAMPFAVSTPSGDNESFATTPFLTLNASTSGYVYTPDEARNNDSITKSLFAQGDNALESGLWTNGPEPRDPQAVNSSITDIDSHNVSYSINSDQISPAENGVTVSMKSLEYDNITLYPHQQEVPNSSEALYNEPLETVTEIHQPPNTRSSELPNTNSSSTPSRVIMSINTSDQEVTGVPTTDKYGTSYRDVLTNDQNVSMGSDINSSTTQQSTPSWLGGADYDSFDGEFDEDSISDDYDDGDADNDSPDGFDDDVIEHGGDIGINEHIFVSRPMSNHFGRSNMYPPHAVHGLIWEERPYMLSVLVPIACGIGGAILIVCVAYCLRNCNSDNSVSQQQSRKQRRPIIVRRVRPRIDHMLLLADTSDDELDRPR